MNVKTTIVRTCRPVSIFVLMIALAVISGAAGSAQRRPAAKKPRPAFLQIRDQELFLGNVHYRNIGATIPNLFDRFLNGEDASATRSLSDAASVGIRFVRCPGITVDPTAFGLFMTDRARWLSAFDRMLAAADANGITLVPSLLYNIETLPAYLRATAHNNEQIADLLTSGSASNNLAVEYVTEIVSRYNNDPRVLFWEIGNEYNRDADLSPAPDTGTYARKITSDQVRAFLSQMAALIHKLDRHHLVTSGNGDLAPDAWRRWRGLPASETGPAVPGTPAEVERDTFDEFTTMLEFINPPGIDIISVHQHPPDAKTVRWLIEDDTHALRVSWIMNACAQMKKPLFVGAFGQPVIVDGLEQPPPWMLDFMRRMQAEGRPLAAVQDWEPAPSGASLPPDALSSQNTPKMAVALKTANAVITASIISESTLAVGPPLQATEQAVQADRLQAQVSRLHDIAVATLAATKVAPDGRMLGSANTTGITLHLPGGYPAFRIRDAAMMLGLDFIPPDEVAGWVRLIAARQAGPNGLHFQQGLTVPPYSIPDHIALEGATGWFPDAAGGENQGSGSYGSLPPADNAFWFIEMAHEHWRLTGKTTLFEASAATAYGRVPLSQVCVHAFDSVAVDAQTGLVTCGAQAGQTRADWGFADTVRKTGPCLMPSLLRYRAARDLVDLFQAAGDTQQADHYSTEADRIKAALPGTFYLPLGQTNGKDTGMLLSATVLGRKDDLWAAAYAVWLGVLPNDQQQAVAQHLLALLQAGGVVADGQVRALPLSGPYGGYWEQSRDAQGEGQNGGYWGLPVGWYAAAIAKVDPASANKLLGDYLTFLQANRGKGAPWEWIDPTHQRYENPGFVASVTLPTIVLRNTSLSP